MGFFEHVSNQHGEKARMGRPNKLQRECRAGEERFETDLDLTRHIKKCHIDVGSANLFPFSGFGPEKSEAMSGDSGSEADQVEVLDLNPTSEGEERGGRRKSRKYE